MFPGLHSCPSMQNMDRRRTLPLQGYSGKGSGTVFCRYRNTLTKWLDLERTASAEDSNISHWRQRYRKVRVSPSNQHPKLAEELGARAQRLSCKTRKRTYDVSQEEVNCAVRKHSKSMHV